MSNFWKNIFGQQDYIPDANGTEELSVDRQSRKQLVDMALHALNSSAKWEEEEKSILANFDYQNGHFQLHLDDNNPYARVLFPFVYTTEMDNLQLVRHVCNESNANGDNEKVIYTINGANNEIDIHVLSSVLILPNNVVQVLSRTLGRMFGWQSAFVRKFERLRQRSEGDKARDPERLDGEWSREMSLLKEMELSHQPVGELRTAMPPREPLRLGELLRTVLGVEKPFSRLTLWIGSEQVVVDDSDSIVRFDLMAKARELGRNEYLAAVVQLSPLEHEECREDVAITLKAEGEDEQAAYYRMTCNKIPNETPASVGYMETGPVVRSFVVAFDKTDGKQRNDEFRYMWKEAVEMHKKGEDEQMTPEQRLVCEIMDENVAGFIYRGKRLFLQKRFAEAIVPLEHAFRTMQRDFDSFKSSMKDVFFEVTYHLGFCHCELRHFAQAAYYLEMLMPLHRINYTIEYVNCLCNSGDMRAENVVDELLIHTDPDRYDEEEGVPQQIQGFRNFLRRRKVYIYIEKGKFEAARSNLREMLNEPENADFAIQELAYIAQQERDKPHPQP
ncbi:MAG: hypothetical protein IKT00_00600 [Prevotella sp.]|nr:hypothetical protein [Prevotella sp.]